MTHPAARLPRPRRPRTLRRDPPRCRCGVPLTTRTVGSRSGECYACDLDNELADPETPAPEDV